MIVYAVGQNRENNGKAISKNWLCGKEFCTNLD